MNLIIKNKNISLTDEISPLYRFINARKALKYNYLNNKNNAIRKNINYKLHFYNKNKEKQAKTPSLKTHSVKLINEQIFIISHFSKNNSPNEINYDYNTSLLNSFGNRNYFRKNKAKINYKIQNNNNFFKTAATNYYYNRKNNINKKKKSSYDKYNLPKLNCIVRKKIKIAL